VLERSERIDALMTALAKAQGQFESVEKDRLNTFYKSRYATLDAVLSAVTPALSANGIALLQGIGTIEPAECIQPASPRDEQGRTPVRVPGVRVTVWTELHCGDQWIRTSSPWYEPRNDPQGIGQGLTYGRRNTLMALLGLAPEDTDGNDSVLEAPRSGGFDPDPFGPSPRYQGKSESKPAAKPAAKPEAKPAPKPEPKPIPVPASKPAPVPDQTQAKPAPVPETPTPAAAPTEPAWKAWPSAELIAFLDPKIPSEKTQRSRAVAGLLQPWGKTIADLKAISQAEASEMVRCLRDTLARLEADGTTAEQAIEFMVNAGLNTAQRSEY
jgi:hypothetical protein